MRYSAWQVTADNAGYGRGDLVAEGWRTPYCAEGDRVAKPACEYGC